ncbi:MAG: hypothetical protein AMS27_14520 [Bacteroides sp. SM23_62_1]|nr:MAG: hypothetical protein AMS27_14520 [Bacteroides sp. SM23_62_1]
MRLKKEAFKYQWINKHTIFHCVSHTFTTIDLNLEIPMEVVSKLLGHKDFKTTQIYAKVLDSYKIKEMRKWCKKRRF